MNADTIVMIYGYIAILSSIAIAVGIMLINSRLKKNPVVFLSKFYTEKIDRQIYAFLSLSIASVVGAVGYAISFAMSIYNPTLLFWRYPTLAVLILIALFYFLFIPRNSKMKLS
ncbi:MAG: hypothetical protein OH316_02085 [Candidatus Parvarchaeota archaeon]|nr:hypothetical protein [Candidatus Parvarchaeota archaeon]